jgi:hypothetical protein
MARKPHACNRGVNIVQQPEGTVVNVGTKGLKEGVNIRSSRRVRRLNLFLPLYAHR